MAVGKKQLHRQQQQPKNQTQFRRRNQNIKPKPGDARQNLRSSSIVKSASVGSGTEVRLYTSHFDARNKINQNKGIKVQPKVGQASQAIAKKAISGVRKGTKPNVSANRNNSNKFASSTPTKKTTFVSGRESTFTGKSIKVSTLNDLAPRERKTLMRGTSLSVVARNKSTKSNKQLNKTINNSNSNNNNNNINNNNNSNNNSTTTWVGPTRTSPEPIAPSINKKAIPAKLVISNLHPNVTQEDILELFGAIGALRDGRLKSVGTAEVVYRVAEDAFAAYSKYHGRNLDGQPMILKITTADEAGSSNFLPPARQSNKVQSGVLPSSASSYPSFSNSATSSGTPVVFTVKL